MSRAMMLDPQPEEDNVDAIENEVDEIQQQEEEVEQPQVEESSLPDKYQGKSLEDIVKMHQEAEKLLGRQSSEVGELRKVVDDYIASQPQSAPQPEHVESEDDIDYFTDPQGAVNRAIENHPKIKEAEQYSSQYKQQAALATLNNKHPDMQEILADPKFAEWIKASKIRTCLLYTSPSPRDRQKSRMPSSA